MRHEADTTDDRGGPGVRRALHHGAAAGALVAVLMAPAPAASQSSPPPTAGWHDGFVVQSDTGDYRLQVGVVVQTDGRFIVADAAPPIADTFTIRKARPVFSGRIARYFEFRLMPDFAGGTAMLFDAYVDVRFSTAFRVRAGKDKTPVGYELLQGDPYLMFPERALPSSLVPNRDVGFQAQGDLAGGTVSYAAGVFNGVQDGASSTTDLDTNNGKDLAGRMLVHPFRSATSSALQGLGMAVGVSSGMEKGALPSFKTSIGQTYFSYDRSAVADGRRTRLTPAVSYYHKAFGGFGEYVRSTQRVRLAAASHDVTNAAWGVAASYVLTGEPASERGIRPARPFDPPTGRWGALQLLGRYSALSVDRAAFEGGFGAPGASRTARAFTLGANWYPTFFVKCYAALERTVFDRGSLGPRPPENTILFRMQLAF